MTLTGSDTLPGATVVDGGTNFCLFSSAATRVQVCLFDAAGCETERFDLHRGSNDWWHGFVADVAAGQRYGFRAHGEYAPETGKRCNPQKLLIDPYAKALTGEYRWCPAVFDYVLPDSGKAADAYRASDLDSAAFVPHGVVTAPLEVAQHRQPLIPWRDVVIYEANVRGYTMRHPDVPAAERGKFRGMANGEILSYLKALGITSVELMPVFQFADEEFLVDTGRRNYWGYNTLNFFCPAGRYAAADPRLEFRDMVAAIHEAGLEVILDVVYNHTAEGGLPGPSVSFRGLDNLAYYRTVPGSPGDYVNDTGTGNTMDADSPVVQQLILNSLRYWADDMDVDGFRFDLAPILGRSMQGYSREHPLLSAINDDPLLSARRLIVEPWDAGPGGYQLGNFPKQFAEWNDRYRDSIRRFWRGDDGEAAEFARRVHGSADIFQASGRDPQASINFVTAHDGFTLADLVSFEHRHNEANGENNRDGHAHNYSANHGVEGNTDDPAILAVRRRQRLNLLATLLLSQGTPMLLAGDELGNSQRGNNNAYAQDNDIGWLDWSGRVDDPQFLAAVRSLIELRRDHPLFRQSSYLSGSTSELWPGELTWLRPDGQAMNEHDWASAKCLTVLLSGDETDQQSDGGDTGAFAPQVALLLNASEDAERFSLPAAELEWTIRFVSAAGDFRPVAGGHWSVPQKSLACLAIDKR